MNNSKKCVFIHVIKIIDQHINLRKAQMRQPSWCKLEQNILKVCFFQTSIIESQWTPLLSSITPPLERGSYLQTPRSLAN